MFSKPPPHFLPVLPVHLQRIYASLHCLVCGVPLNEQQVQQGHVCAQVSCQHHYYHMHKIRHKHSVVLVGKIPPTFPRCIHCNWPLTMNEALQATPDTLANGFASCSDPVCIQHADEAAQERKQQQAIRIQKYQAYRAQLRQTLEQQRDAIVDDPQAWPLLLLPSHTRELVALSPDQRQAVQAHWVGIIQTALTETPPENPARTPADSSLYGAACGLCKGNCCTSSDGHNYLDTQVIHNYRVEFPEANADGVLAALMACLPTEVYQDSCVYHDQHGCGLGHWRGRVCQEYMCPSLRQVQEEQMTQAWGACLTASEPFWLRTWPLEGDEVLEARCLA